MLIVKLIISSKTQNTVLKSVFLLGIILSSVIFTPFAFGQESEDSASPLQKSPWVESM